MMGKYMGCPRVDSNHHAFTGTGPQPAAYTIPPRGQIITDFGDYFIPNVVNCQRLRGISSETYFWRTIERLRAVNIGCCSLSVPVVSVAMNVMGPVRPSFS